MVRTTTVPSEENLKVAYDKFKFPYQYYPTPVAKDAREIEVEVTIPYLFSEGKGVLRKGVMFRRPHFPEEVQKPTKEATGAMISSLRVHSRLNPFSHMPGSQTQLATLPS